MKLFISLGLLFCNIVMADPPPAPKNLWRNTNYYDHYIIYEQSSNTYIETVGCKAAWRFTKIGGDLNSVILRDASRKLNVKITYGDMSLKFDSDAAYKFYQYGTFSQHVRFFHQYNGQWTGTVSRKAGCQWEELLAGHTTPSWYFRSYGEDANSAYLYDSSRNMRVRLDNGEMWLQQSGQPVFSFFKKGYWSAY